MQTENAMPSYGPSEPTRQPEVSTQMERLGMNCEVLEKQIGELEQRLMTVLAQRAGGGSDNQKTPEPVRVPLAQAIYDRTCHLVSLSDKLASIINRIEL